MNGVQGAIAGLVALAVVGGGAFFMLAGGGGPATPGTLGNTDVQPVTAGTATPTGDVGDDGAPIPLPIPKVVGSGATVATAQATHYDPNNPPEQPAQTFLDYVCRRQVPADRGITLIHMGTTYHFCTEACRAKFEKTPDDILFKRSHGE